MLVIGQVPLGPYTLGQKNTHFCVRQQKCYKKCLFSLLAATLKLAGLRANDTRIKRGKIKHFSFLVANLRSCRVKRTWENMSLNFLLHWGYRTRKICHKSSRSNIPGLKASGNDGTGSHECSECFHASISYYCSAPSSHRHLLLPENTGIPKVNSTWPRRECTVDLNIEDGDWRYPF